VKTEPKALDRCAKGKTQQFRIVEHRDRVVPGLVSEREPLKEVEIQKTGGTSHDESIGANLLDVGEFLTSHAEGEVAVAHTGSLTAAVQFVLVGNRCGAEGVNQRVKEGRTQRIIYLQEMARSQEVATIVECHTETAQRVLNRVCNRGYSNVLVKELDDVFDLRVALVLVANLGNDSIDLVPGFLIV
jgi:hypothetical protein